MKTAKQTTLGLIILISFVFAASLSWGDDIKQRMKQRLPEIINMKAQGIIGENARGYLEFVSGKKINQNIIENENKDRRTVYEAIAKQQGVSLEKVESLRALQIVKKADRGDFLKDESGKWYRK